MADIINTGTIQVNGTGILITVSTLDPGISWTIVNSGIIEATLDGVQVVADPSTLTATGTFIIDNSGVIKSTVGGNAINFDILVSSPGSITITNQETGLIEAATGDAIVIAGNSVDTINNKGTIIGGISTAGGADIFNLFTGSSISGLVDSGSGNDTVNLYGNGHSAFDSFVGVEVVNLFSGDWTLGSENVISVNLQDGLQTLSLGTTVLADGQFSGTINNFSSGDIIDLTGIGLATSATLDASNVLTIVGGSAGSITLQLDPAQDFDGQQFQLTADGAGGTNITLAPASGTGVVLAGTVGDDTLIGGVGDDVINSRDGNDQIFGGKGDDTIRTGDGASLLDGGKGNDTLIAGDGDSNVLAGGDGKDFLAVGDGNNNTLSGGGGADTFHVGTGNNLIIGGKGSDTFVFGPDFGEDVIADFGHNDQIQFDGVFADFQALLDATHQVGDNTVINLDAGHSITLTGVSVASLHASDFLLA